MKWISVKNELPKECGWYKIKTIHGDFEAPFVRCGNGSLVWVLPDVSIITHWMHKEPNDEVIATQQAMP